MSSELMYQSYYLWKDTRIGKPPQRKELVLGFKEIRKALLSFKFDMQSGSGTKLDPTQGVLVNDKLVPGMDLPPNKHSKSLEFVERTDLDITSLLRTGESGEKNIVEVNYLLSPVAVMQTRVPSQTIGTLSLEIRVFYPGTIEKVIVPPRSKFCMWDGKPIPRDSVVCPYCQKMPPPGGVNTKKCVKCDTLLPPQAAFCEECGGEQPSTATLAKSCINPNCKKALSADAVFCDKCGTKQLEYREFKEEKTLCVRCGNQLAGDAAFCSRCGAEQPRR